MSDKREMSHMLDGSELIGFAAEKSEGLPVRGTARTSTAKFDKAKSGLSKAVTRSRG